MTVKPQTQCPDCSKVLKLKSDTLFGRKTKCPSCSGKFIIEPYPPEAVILEEDEDDFGFDDESTGFDTGSAEDDYGFGGASSGPLKPKKVVRVKTEEERIQEELREQHRKYKKANARKKASMTVQVIAWLIGGGISGLICAIVWAMIAYSLHRELGLVAWALGGIVGAGVYLGAMLTGAGPCPASGIVAAVISFFSLILGKVLIMLTLLVMPFSPWDLLFFPLAVYTALKVGAVGFEET